MHRVGRPSETSEHGLRRGAVLGLTELTSVEVDHRIHRQDRSALPDGGCAARLAARALLAERSRVADLTAVLAPVDILLAGLAELEAESCLGQQRPPAGRLRGEVEVQVSDHDGIVSIRASAASKCRGRGG